MISRYECVKKRVSQIFLQDKLRGCCTYVPYVTQRTCAELGDCCIENSTSTVNLDA